MFQVYILESLKDKTLYIGHTNNLKSRIFRHNAGMVKSTKNRKPWKVIHKENYQTKSDAVRRELYLKSLKSPKYIKDRIINKAA